MFADDHKASTGVIFALVGPSGAGKTRLIKEMLCRFPQLAVMRSLTTRARRDSDDDETTQFVSRNEFVTLAESGLLVQWIEYDGQLYGDAKADVDQLLGAGRCGIRPLIEEGVRRFRARGYRVAVARINPAGDDYRSRSPQRETIDAGRGAVDLSSDVEIENRFEAGGFAAASDELAMFIETRLRTLGGDPK